MHAIYEPSKRRTDLPLSLPLLSGSRIVPVYRESWLCSFAIEQANFFRDAAIVFAHMEIMLGDKIAYYSTHCNTAKYGYGALNIRRPYTGVNGKIKIVSSFSALKLYFVIKGLINKIVVLLNLVEYPLILVNSASGLIS